MRTLPQNPSLDYLRQQAKDLLHAIRETQPDASLSDAQKTLAQQYGFRTWTEMRAEVERLRGRADVADPELVSGIAKAFDLGDVTAPGVVLTTDEVMGPELRIETSSGRWFAHAVLDWVDAGQAEEAIRLMGAARAAGIDTHSPVRSPSGSLVEETGEGRWRVDEWMDLGPSLAKPAPTMAAKTVGEIAGTLHNLNIVPAREMNPWLTQRRTPERWREIVQIVEKQGATWVRALEDALPAILDISAAVADEPPEKLILSHTDLIGSNLRMGREGSLVVLGWEFAGAIPPSWDLGMLLHSWSEGPDDHVDESRVRTIVDAYAAVTGSRPALELSAFSPAITAWLNWLVSRMNYALGGEEEARERAAKELLNMLAFPLTRDKLKRILRAME